MKRGRKNDGPLILLMFGLVGLYFWGNYLDERFRQE